MPVPTSQRQGLPLAPVALLAGLLAAGIAGQARAQGYGNQGYAAPVQDWTGPYLGAHVGGGVGDAGPANTSGLVGGVQAGYNFQTDQLVFGAEADLTASGIDHSGFTLRYRQTWTGTVRGRVGYAFDRTLIYGTAGIAGTGSELRDAVVKSTRTQAGVALGAGAEYKLSPNVMLRGELLHYNYGNETFQTSTGPVTLEPSTNVLRGGVNLKF